MHKIISELWDAGEKTSTKAHDPKEDGFFLMSHFSLYFLISIELTYSWFSSFNDSRKHLSAPVTLLGGCRDHCQATCLKEAIPFVLISEGIVDLVI